MTPFAIAGLAVFALVGLALLTQRDWLTENDREHWLWICLAGFLWGLPGLATMIVHDRHRRTRLAQRATGEQQ